MADVRKFIIYTFKDYFILSEKLEAFAREGLLLKSIGPLFWTFSKGKPKELKYTIKFSKEGSLFNPKPTDSQLDFFSHAKSIGWDLVCEFNNLQVFSSELDNPEILEPNEEEKLSNIHNCMKSSVILSEILLLLLYALNLFPVLIEPLNNASILDLSCICLFSFLSINSILNISTYLIWYFKSKRSVSNGGSILILKPTQKFKKGFLVAIFIPLFFILLEAFKKSNFISIILAILTFPILVFIFYGTSKLLKHLKVSKEFNMLITCSIYFLFGLLYFQILFRVI